MKLYFTLKSIPQFADLTESERRTRYRYYYKKMRSHWLVWLPMVIMITGEVVLLNFMDDLFGIGYALLIGIGYLLVASTIYNGLVYGLIASYMKNEKEKGSRALVN